MVVRLGVGSSMSLVGRIRPWLCLSKPLESGRLSEILAYPDG